MTNLINAQFSSMNGSVEFGIDNSVCLVAKKTCEENYSQIMDGDFSFSIDEKISLEDYLVMEYSCFGLRRPLSFRKACFVGINYEENIPLFCYDDMFFDGRRHSIIIKTEKKELQAIEINLGIDRKDEAHLKIYNIYTCNEKELPVKSFKNATEESENLYTVDISNQFNSTYMYEENMIDGGRFFEKTNINVSRIPFRVKCAGLNLIAPPASPKENEEIVDNFGAKAKRRVCRPVSRDSKISIPVEMKATELFFLLNLRGKRHQRWGFASDGIIIGTYGGDVTMPLIANDAEQFVVEIEYADGKSDYAVPLNIEDNVHGVSGDLGVYGVPCSDEYIKNIIFHNKMLDSECAVAALTVNNTSNRLFPDMQIPELKEFEVINLNREKEITLSNNILNILNGAISMKADISKGMKLIELKNLFVEKMETAQTDMLKIKIDENSVSSEFILSDCILKEQCAKITFLHNEIEVIISISIEGDDDIKFETKIRNIGNKKKISVIFPAVSNLKYIDNNDGWYFFPKYQNINSNESVFIYEESAPSFPMQFFDVYSPLQNGGLSITTQEKELNVRKYALNKNENGISFFIEYPQMYNLLEDGEEKDLSPTVFSAHCGDWRKSFDIYKSWLDSWYEPYKCQNKKWYRECFWLISEIIDFYETEEFTNLPIWYDKDKKQFNLEFVLDEHEKIHGCKPDILHMWSWTFRRKDGIYSQLWGNFGSVDYDKYDGLENFRNALHEVMDKKDVYVSLYLHPTLLSEIYDISKEYFPKYRTTDKAGEFINVEGDSYRMCHANKHWRDYALNMYPRIYNELSVPILYVDEFSLRIENRCYNENHGHCVPSNLLKTDRDFISELKDIVPEELVLYGEYAAVDVNARYIDCNITYYIIDSVVDMIETAWRGQDGSDKLGRVFTDAYRFAFPKIVQLVLPMAMRNMSWHPQKFIFFNGEALYDSFWDCEESDGLDFTVKAYKLKKKYKDCFSSDNPKMMVDTLSPAICANCFPGENETVYTIYNRAYSTYRGKILKIKHSDNAKYYDVWNDRELQVEIIDGYAEISMEIHTQQIGCIVVTK